MKTRILTGTIGGLIFLFLLLKGGALLAIAVGFLVALGTWEISRLSQAAGIDINFPLILSFSLLFTFGQAIVLHYDLPVGNGELVGLFLVLILLFSFLSHLGKEITQALLFSIFANLFALVYPGIVFTYILLIRAFPAPFGWQILIFAFLVIWGTDTGANFIGSALGKNPLAPRISPHKTIEGAMGGLLVGTVCGMVFGLIVKLPLLWVVGTSLLTSLMGQLGDLFESFLKRTVEIKDSGSFLPGHGGVLDRFDSALFALPLAFYLALLIVS